MADLKTLVIEFEDHGQDFLVWEVTILGHGFGQIDRSYPYQGSIWAGQFVLNMDDLKPGGLVEVSPSPNHKVTTINYPILSVIYPAVEKEVSNG